jgi:hypothetical protein
MMNIAATACRGILINYGGKNCLRYHLDGIKKLKMSVKLMNKNQESDSKFPEFEAGI